MSLRQSDELASIFEERGPEGFVRFIDESVSPDEDGEVKMDAEDISMKALFEAISPEEDHILRVGEANPSGVFAKATGALINQYTIRGYEAAEKIGERLTTTISSSLRDETIVGLNALEMPMEVPEGSEYPGAEMGEKWVSILNRKYGRIIQITEEAIKFDQTNMILERARRQGARAAQHKDKKIIRGVTELDSDIYRPSGTAATLYDDSAYSNNNTSAGFSTTNLATAIQDLRDMTDEQSEPIVIPMPWLLLVPTDLEQAALEMYASDKDPDASNDGANVYKGRYDPIVSPYLTDSNDWYLGNFAEQFVWTEVFPVEAITLAGGGEVGFYRDVKAVHKVRYMGGIGAVDTKYVMKNEG